MARYDKMMNQMNNDQERLINEYLNGGKQWVGYAYKLPRHQKEETFFNGGFKERLFFADENNLYYTKFTVSYDPDTHKQIVKLVERNIPLNIIKNYYEHRQRLILYNNEGKVELVLQNYDDDFRSWVANNVEYLPARMGVSSDLGLEHILAVREEHVDGGKKKRKNRKSKKRKNRKSKKRKTNKRRKFSKKLK